MPGLIRGPTIGYEGGYDAVRRCGGDLRRPTPGAAGVLGLCAAERRSRRVLPIRLGPRTCDPVERDDQGQGGAHAAVLQPHAAVVKLFPGLKTAPGTIADAAW